MITKLNNTKSKSKSQEDNHLNLYHQIVTHKHDSNPIVKKNFDLVALCNPFDLGLIASIANNGQDKEEEIDNVKVQVEGGKDVFLWGQAVFVFSSQHHLGVKNQVLKKKV